MPISIAGSPVGSIFHGSTPISEVYEGADLLWSATGPRTRVDYGWESARTAPYRIMFMGSSTTQGYQILHSERFVPQMTAHIVSNLLGANATPMVARTSGTQARPTANGFHFLNAGLGGTNSVTYWGDNRKSLVNSYRPRLIVHMIGSNDYSQGMNPSTYKANVERAITEANNRTDAGCRHLLIHAFQRLDVTDPAYPWADYGTALRQIAAARDDTDFCDIERVLGDRWTGEDMLLGDKVHANWFGNTMLARAVSEYLNFDMHEGDPIYEWDFLGSNLSDGIALSSHPPSEASYVKEPLTSSGNNRPIIKNRSGVRSADFYNGALKMSADWGGAFAAPMTVFFVARMWNDGFGTNVKPLFTRRTSADDGYMWLWRETNTNRVKTAMNSGVSPGASVPRNVIDSPSITAVTFHPNGWTTLYINATYGTDIPPRNPASTNGPWMKSLKLMTNTGETSWGEADMYGIYFYKGMGPALVGRKMRELGELHNIPVRDQPE